jgi:hypothetical protein
VLQQWPLLVLQTRGLSAIAGPDLALAVLQAGRAAPQPPQLVVRADFEVEDHQPDAVAVRQQRL